jgi:TorA maturation chaperone TorD
MAQTTSSGLRIEEEDRLRADLYRLVGGLLSCAPDRETLAALGALIGDESDLGRAVDALSASARTTTPEAAAEEYQDLFIGVGRGELVPYGSYYLTGFLNEKPLARLRADMAPLGIERAEDVKEPEDHAGALMEMMAGLIDGAFGTVHPLSVQKEFFARHVGSWMTHFFADLEAAKGARLYRPLGRIGELFLALEAASFEM